MSIAEDTSQTEMLAKRGLRRGSTALALYFLSLVSTNPGLRSLPIVGFFFGILGSYLLLFLVFVFAGAGCAVLAVADAIRALRGGSPRRKPTLAIVAATCTLGMFVWWSSGILSLRHRGSEIIGIWVAGVALIALSASLSLFRARLGRLFVPLVLSGGGFLVGFLMALPAGCTSGTTTVGQAPPPTECTTLGGFSVSGTSAVPALLVGLLVAVVVGGLSLAWITARERRASTSASSR